MNVIYVSTLCSRNFFEKIIKNSNKKVEQQGQKYHELIVSGLLEHGLHIDSITTRPINRQMSSKIVYKYEKEKNRGIIFRYLPTINFPPFKNIFIFLGSAITTLSLFLKKKDSVVICDVLNVAVVSGSLIVSKILKKKCVAIVTDVPLFLHKNNKSLRTKINMFILDKFDNYLFLTEDMNNLLNKKNKHYIVIEGQVDINMQKKDNYLSDKFDTKICMYTGGLQKIYGINYLVEGFIQANVENSELHIYGTGDFEDNLIEICKKTNKVKYFGVVPNQEIVEKQLRATLLVNPRPTNEEYTKYSFPSKNMEYMVSGTPTLTTKLPGMPVEYYPYVYLIEDETVDGISKNFKYILNKSPEELHNKGLEAKNFVLEFKNNIVQAKKILDMLNS